MSGATAYFLKEGQDRFPNICAGFKLRVLADLYPSLDKQQPWFVIDITDRKTYLNQQLDDYLLQSGHTYVVKGSLRGTGMFVIVFCLLDNVVCSKVQEETFDLACSLNLGVTRYAE